MNKLAVSLFISGFLLAGSGWAQGHPAEILVKETAEKILQQLRAEREVVTKDNNRVFELVDAVVLPHFDFYKMSAWVLGKYWRKATPDQKDRFTHEFKILLVRTYSKALVDNMDRQIEYIPLRANEGADDLTVRTEIPQDGGFPLPINYSMYLKDGAWKVYDVDIDGISMVKNYRTTFGNEIRDGSIDNLISKLKKRNDEAANE